MILAFIQYGILNAKVGKERDGGITGKFELGTCNKHGE